MIAAEELNARIGIDACLRMGWILMQMEFTGAADSGCDCLAIADVETYKLEELRRAISFEACADQATPSV